MRRTFAWPLYITVLLPYLWIRTAEPGLVGWSVGAMVATALLLLPMLAQSLGDFPWLHRRMPSPMALIGAGAAGAIGVAAAVLSPDARLTRLVLLALIWQAGLALGGFIGVAPALLGAGVSAGLVALAEPSSDSGPSIGMAAVAFLVAWALIWSTQWYLVTLRNLERAQLREASLAVAEERLRIARDLHDVLGQRFTAIAVKSELGSQLAQHGSDTSAAIGQFQEVRELAHQSLADLRGLVRSYRASDLADELSGARSLLQSAGVEVAITGDDGTVAEEHRDLAGIVLRESVTNILRHSRATKVEIIPRPELHRSGQQRRGGGRGRFGIRRQRVGRADRTTAGCRRPVGHHPLG